MRNIIRIIFGSVCIVIISIVCYIYISQNDSETRIINIGKYNGLQYTSKELSITDLEIEAKEEELIGLYCEYNDSAKENVQQNDIVSIDYLVYDGDNVIGRNENAIMDVGLGYYYENLENQLINKKVGDVFETSILLPETHENSDYAGKTVKLKVLINSIKVLVQPELTEEFLHNNFGVETMNEFHEYSKQLVYDEKSQEELVNQREELISTIVKNSEYFLSEEDISEYTLIAEKKIGESARKFGISAEEFVNDFCDTELSYSEYCIDYGMDILKRKLIFDKISKDEDIQLTNSEKESIICKLKEDYGNEYNEYSDEAEINVTNEKVLQWIIDHANAQDK